MNDEDFLKRWSRRKREVAAAEKAAPPVAEAKSVENATASETTESSTEAQSDVEVTLPPIESITELSDVTAFLRAGVPADLARAALRRVWTIDPSIRDFVGLAENSWDFTDPTAMPGFGPLEGTEEVRRMIAQVVDQIGRAAQTPTPESSISSENSNYSNAMVAEPQDETCVENQQPADHAETSSAQIVRNEVLVQSEEENAASQHNPTEAKEKSKQAAYRGHGRALPQ